MNIADFARSATLLIWFVMGQRVKDAMLLGDESIRTPQQARQYAAETAHVFIATHH